VRTDPILTEAKAQQRALRGQREAEKDKSIRRMVGDGLNNAEIASALNVDVRRVRRVQP